MPQTLTFPGVYIEEIPSSVRPITGVATSIAAFVDYFTRGPIDTAVQVLSVADFEREFGGLNAQSEASYAVHQFFLNGGAQAWIIRVGRDSASPNHLATASLDIDDTAATPLVRVTAGERIRGKSVENPGTWANFLRVEVDYDVAVPPDPTQTAAELFNLTVSEVAVRGGQQVTLRRETFRNLTFRPGAVNNALEVVNAGSKLVQLELLGTLATPFAAILPAATGTVGTALPTSPSIPTDGSAFNVKVNGGSNISCTLNYGGTTPADYPTLRSYVEAAIRAEAGTDPKLANVSVRLWGNGSTALPYRFAVVARTGAGEITPTDQLSFNNATATQLRLAAGVVNDLQYAPAGSGLGGDGLLPGAAELEGIRANKTGLYALQDVDLFNILCIPRAADLGSSDMQAVVAAGEQYCEERRAFMIVDIPATVGDPPAIQAWMSANDSLRRANARRRGPAGVGVEVHPRPAPCALPRREPLSLDEVGRLRAERRAAVGADPAQRGCVHAQPLPPGRIPGHHPARGLPRQVRQGDDDPERHRQRGREHHRRLRAAQAGRVRDHQDPAARRADRDLTGATKGELPWPSSPSMHSGSIRTRTSSSA